MRQLRDEDLILYYYGEAEDPEEVRALLESSPELSARYEALRRTLETAGEAFPVPERPESYGAEVWEKLQPALAPRALTPAPSPEPGEGRNKSLRRFRLLPFSPSPARRERGPGGEGRWIGLAAAAVLLLVVGFLAGRLWPRPDEARIAEQGAFSSEARQRILVRTVATHLERSERLLTELANAETDGSFDISAERQWAEDLLTANRLYRQSTQRGGRPMLSSLLDDLEPFLLELAHGPSEIAAEDLRDLRARLEEQALLFKMRVVSQRLERDQQSL
ncbi:MAG TPA: hypothetical protein VF756_00505 [Thermoanaerobaculia bacterium]